MREHFTSELLSSFDVDDPDARSRRALESNPQGLTYEQALEAFCAYLTPDGKAELQWVIERDFAREIYGPIAPVPEISEEAYARFQAAARQLTRASVRPPTAGPD
jgi:hypothetical protein